MGASRGRLAAALLVLFELPHLSQAADALPMGRVLPLSVCNGRCTCVLPTEHAGEKYYLIVGSLARAPGPFRLKLQTEPTGESLALPLHITTTDAAWSQRIHELRARLDCACHAAPAAPEYPPALPPADKVFYLFTNGKDFQDSGDYATVAARLRAVGRHCQVYVDASAPSAALQPTIDDTVHTFDDVVYPRARAKFGPVLDVDRDGRFTILFSSWLGKMSGGSVSIGGFVRGSDWYRDLAAPFGNRCDMMYLNTDLVQGPHLRSVLAHEYMHAVVFSEHVFGGYLPELPRQDEEAWLNEALAHLAEDQHGFSWSNLDYRISAFLSDPEDYALVVPDYYSAGLWRRPGNRGATYLFLRWCADRLGPDLCGRLVHSSLAGVANLEVATGHPFPELFRGWTAALALGGTGLCAEKALQWDHPDLRQPLGGRLLCGPRFAELPLVEGHHEGRLAGTSAAYFLLHSPSAAHSRLTIEADPGAEVQVSLVRLPPESARLTLRSRKGEQPGTVRLTLHVHDSPVTLEAFAWERLHPSGNRPEDSSYRGSEPLVSAVRALFGDPHLRAGEVRTSAPIPIPVSESAEDGFVCKLAATDAAGRRIAAWALTEEIACPHRP
jgi:hypothetical protein